MGLSLLRSAVSSTHLSDVEGRQLLVAVEQQAVELVAFQKFLLDCEGAVVGFIVSLSKTFESGRFIVGVVVEGVEATLQVGDVVAAEDGRPFCAAGDVAVEHTVHHHGVDAGGGGGGIVVAHDAADVCAAGDGGEAVAVDDAGGAVEGADEAAGVGGAADGAGEDADVIDAGGAVGGAGYGSGIASMAADGHLVKYQVAHGAGEGLEEGDSEATDAVGHLGGGVDGRL